jgi:SNF2 family DNA or RNA helicase
VSVDIEGKAQLWPLGVKFQLSGESKAEGVVEIRPGITTLVGPNGSGKTRALRAIKSALEYTGRIGSYGRKTHLLAAGRSSPLEPYRAAIHAPSSMNGNDAAVGNFAYRQSWWNFESVTGVLLVLDNRADLRLKVEARLQQLFDRSVHEKVLVFTQFREMGELLRGWLGERYGRAPQFLHGGVARKKRDDMVEHFQHDRTERVFLLSLKAGGTGLNLTAASSVIHFDLWWNPAVEAQATDRAYRIGQRSNVQVHRLITEATFEERINDMIKGKRELAELAVGTGEQWIGNLSDHELHSLFTLNRA